MPPMQNCPIKFRAYCCANLVEEKRKFKNTAKYMFTESSSISSHSGTISHKKENLDDLLDRNIK
ncbi:hypothetical protein LIPSTDRAFT_73307 [Lipomyces starkeyi NRRL Y-11557]|uniref:Uncharacterized protein n=1 Tax=Lipomyces starkeyi NRRL Y-11557 TaxID=675824 RepID=A0A1E3Q3J4_LIPST|nr:hypothetical protein LIPSTDRAFT_73307 [Lipomyces starkeyi NRRL Y-11557]